MEINLLSIKTHKDLIRRNLIDLSIHFFVSFSLALIIYSASGNLKHSIILVLGGILIDLDHFIDYFLFFKNKLDIKGFFANAYLKSGKVYILLHSWEIILFTYSLSLLIKSTDLMMLSFGFIAHLIIDNLQRKNLLLFLLSYRFIKKFDTKVLLPEFNFLK